MPVIDAELPDGNTIEVEIESGGTIEVQIMGTGPAGVSPDVSVASIAGGHRVSVTDAGGTETFDVMDGVDGQDGAPGADGQDGQDGADGIGVPSGGTTGQYLVKASNTDYDTEWVSGGGGGSTEVFRATYGTTTSAQIEAAYQAGMVCVCDYSGQTYYLTYRGSSTVHTFTCYLSNVGYFARCSSDTWTNGTIALAPSNSPTLTGTPTAPTATSGDNSTQIATTAFVQAALPSVPSAATSNPADLGTAAVGSSSKYAKEDHVHNKPTYSKSDVGLGNVDNVQQYSATNPPPYPVSSVNGQTGAVSLSIPSSASDVGAVAVAQGVGHAGEFLVVGSDGNVTTVTLATWQGGSY